ncbi:8-oxoguanine deaminase [Pseudactinotalea sp. HY160]|uniref:8-oxoguanine deaminase n=1 Tax=Pseudactinotalea sp. HY160 TaxID=2654490 RepID=UPI00128B1B9C|nr:8-oxoguanine deaminase [Pseudactinotalea sp. HY160]MPV48828.1 8-oxoguanine deaminase [Pseudactinotalea sp. HY160]
MAHDLLIKNGYIVIDSATEIAGGWIAVTDSRVSAYGTGGGEPEASRVVDAHGRLVTPGLVNTHHHIYQNLTRSYAPAVNGSLFNWLTTLYPIWAAIDEEASYLSTAIGLIELAMGGCTTTMDHMYVHPRPHLIDAQVQAGREIGLRFMPTRGSMTRSVEDGGLPPAEVVQDPETILIDSERLIRAYHDATPGAMTRIALAPCSPFSVTEDLMKATAELAETHDVRLHSHLAEDEDEDTFCAEVYGCRPVEYLERVGWASPRTWVAHFIFPNDDEQQRLADAGVGVAHCPSSNMLIGGGTAAVQHLRSIGMNVGIGTDGSASTDHASMWMEARNALLLGRYRGGPAAMAARDALDIATRGGAECLGWADEIGHLRRGACADLVVWDTHPVALAGALSDPVEAWLRCGPSRAFHTVVNGDFIVENREPTTSALDDLLRRHRAKAAEIQPR